MLVLPYQRVRSVTKMPSSKLGSVVARKSLVGGNYEGNPCSRVHFVVQFVCCCHSCARSIRCTDRKVPSCTIMLTGQGHLRDRRQPPPLCRYASDLDRTGRM